MLARSAPSCATTVENFNLYYVSKETGAAGGGRGELGASIRPQMTLAALGLVVPIALTLLANVKTPYLHPRIPEYSYYVGPSSTTVFREI